ncbi:MAG TPA: 7TM diverse intracellular signaling domain-containing protein [Symbiobacteriaceae bacterium]|nr:7TM diverse intracellular signaling domain-containing protein [Symbiobacteriaceae bacterium]
MSLLPRQAGLVVVVFLSALLALLLSSTIEKPGAQRGVLDLTHWNPEAEAPAVLDGEWSFYWDQLLGPEIFLSERPEPTGFLSLPGTWRRFPQGDKRLPADGHATLHLRVSMPQTSKLMAVRIPAVYSAYQLWANGNLIATGGTVGRSASDSIPQYRVQIAVFEPPSAAVDLVLQISNYHHDWSGLARSIQIGTFETVVANQGRNLRLWSSALGALTLLGLQNLFLFFIRGRQECHLLFSILILSGAATAANDNELIFSRMAPGFGWEVHWKIEYLAGFLLIILAARLVQTLFPQQARAGAFRAALLMAGAGIFLVLLTPARIYTPIQPVFHIMGIVTIIYCMSVGIKATYQDRPNAWMIVLSVLAISVWLALEWPRYYGILTDNVYIGVMAALAASLGMAFIHLVDHRQLSKATKVLSTANSALNARLRQQVAELQAARARLSAQEEEMRRKTSEFLQSRVQSKLIVVGHHLEEAENRLETDPEKGRGPLELAQWLVEEVREKDIRSISHLLHPTAISLGLEPAVRSLAAEYAHQFRVTVDIKPEVTVLDDITENRIPEGVRLTAYRVLTEALGNVKAHARATEVRVELSQTSAGDLVMTITDNGRGFDQAATKPGLGLKTVAARLSECDGALEWKSRPGSGTCLRVRIPLQNSAN